MLENADGQIVIHCVFPVAVADHDIEIPEVVSKNIAEDINVRQVLGIAYQDDCSYFELAYERKEGRDRELGPSEAIRFKFALKTLGALGDNNFD